MQRNPVVAGKFYPGTQEALKKQLEQFLQEAPQQKDAFACILPHAGYIFSGSVALQTAASVLPKKNLILLGPNHTGLGSPFSIMPEGSWDTPFGEVEINSEIAKEILARCSFLKEDKKAHEHEHSLEVELPIFQFLYKSSFSFVPIALMAASHSLYRDLANAIAQTITSLEIVQQTLIVISSDMTHYEPQETAKDKDKIAIEAILQLDENALSERIKKFDISMCGYVPAIVGIMAAKQLGASRAELVTYQTSGEVSGDYDAVVGYAGITIS